MKGGRTIALKGVHKNFYMVRQSSYEDCLTMWADLRELDYNIVACTRKQILRLQDISKGSGLYFYPSQWQSGKITACHPKGHLGCGHYVVRSCTLSCFHSYPRLKLTFTIIAMQKSRSHPPFILYEDCLTMWADLRDLEYKEANSETSGYH